MSASTLAKALWQARQDGTTIDAETVETPGTNAEAYAVQWEIAALAGAAVAGFKIGSTSLEAQRLLGTTEPGSAALLAPYVFQSPAAIAVARGHMPAVEGEFAFRMGRTLTPRTAPYSRPEIADAVDGIAGAIEVVGTRFAGGLTGKGRLLTTADGGVNIALAIGCFERNWCSLDLPAHPVRMLINGSVKGEGTGARALGDPWNVLVWLVNQQTRLGRSIEAGWIITTGTCTGLDPVMPGDRVRAEFGALGQVDIDIGELS